MSREIRVCEECANCFVPRVHQQRFCTPSCNRGYHSRNQSRGASLVPIAMEWRNSRGKVKERLMEMCALLDKWKFDDRERTERVQRAIDRLKESQAKIGKKVVAS